MRRSELRHMPSDASMIPYRSAAATKPDKSRDLYPLLRTYEERYRRGGTMIELFICGLIPLGHPTFWSVTMLCVLPCCVALPFMVLSTAERFLRVPSDVEARAHHLGVFRKRIEPRCDWVGRLLLREDQLLFREDR